MSYNKITLELTDEQADWLLAECVRGITLDEQLHHLLNIPRDPLPASVWQSVANILRIHGCYDGEECEEIVYDSTTGIRRVL